MLVTYQQYDSDSLSVSHRGNRAYLQREFRKIGAVGAVIDLNVLLGDHSISRLKCLSTGSYIVTKKIMQQQSTQ